MKRILFCVVFMALCCFIIMHITLLSFIGEKFWAIIHCFHQCSIKNRLSNDLLPRVEDTFSLSQVSLASVNVAIDFLNVPRFLQLLIFDECAHGMYVVEAPFVLNKRLCLKLSWLRCVDTVDGKLESWYISLSVDHTFYCRRNMSLKLLT